MQNYSPQRAKQFFIEKVISQAARSNVPLSEAEKYMLAWTEEEGEFAMDQKMMDKFEEETTEDAFEKKVRGLLEASYSVDVKADPSIKKAYREAYAALKKQDHYILVMINDSIAPKLKKWLFF